MRARALVALPAAWGELKPVVAMSREPCDHWYRTVPGLLKSGVIALFLIIMTDMIIRNDLEFPKFADI